MGWLISESIIGLPWVNAGSAQLWRPPQQPVGFKRFWDELNCGGEEGADR